MYICDIVSVRMRRRSMCCLVEEGHLFWGLCNFWPFNKMILLDHSEVREQTSCAAAQTETKYGFYKLVRLADNMHTVELKLYLEQHSRLMKCTPIKVPTYLIWQEVLMHKWILQTWTNPDDPDFEWHQRQSPASDSSDNTLPLWAYVQVSRSPVMDYQLQWSLWCTSLPTPWCSRVGVKLIQII